MQLTIKLPDIVSEKQLSKYVEKIKDFFATEGMTIEIKQEVEIDPWDTLNLDKIAVDTGIEDFAEKHDNYLYGNQPNE